MTPSGIEPATFRFVAQRLNHCATADPQILLRVRQFTRHHSICPNVMIIAGLIQEEVHFICVLLHFHPSVRTLYSVNNPLRFRHH